jgi:hypothetical protein
LHDSDAFMFGHKPFKLCSDIMSRPDITSG